jgi:hypothetical protein
MLLLFLKHILPLGIGFHVSQDADYLKLLINEIIFLFATGMRIATINVFNFKNLVIVPYSHVLLPGLHVLQCLNRNLKAKHGNGDDHPH